MNRESSPSFYLPRIIVGEIGINHGNQIIVLMIQGGVKESDSLITKQYEMATISHRHLDIFATASPGHIIGCGVDRRCEIKLNWENFQHSLLYLHKVQEPNRGA